MKKGIVTIACAMGLLLAVGNARAALIIGDAYYVGSITDGNPASETLEIGYINYLITLAPGTGDTPDPIPSGYTGEIYNRAESSITGLLPTTGNFQYKEADSDLDGSWTYNLDRGFYILGKYDAGNAGSLVWFVHDAEFGTVFTLPAKFNNKDLSHLSVYSDSSPVPVPGTLVLFGSGLVGLATVARRRLRK